VRSTFAVAMAVLVLAWAPRATGQPAAGQPAEAEPAPIAEAEEERRAALYKDGVALADQGRWAEAAERFRDAIAIRSAPKALVALAVAEENLGHLVAAERLYGQAVAEARTAGLGEDEATALTALRLLTPRVPRVALALPRDVPVTSLLVDGKPAAAQDGELVLDPGVHEIEIDAAGYEHYRTRVTLKEGSRERLNVRLARTAAPAPVAPPADRRTASPPVGALVLLGLGAAVAGTGMALWAIGKGRENDVSARCPDDRCPEQERAELQPEIDGAHDNIVAGNLLVLGGALAAAAGGTWWVVSVAVAPAPSAGPSSVRATPRSPSAAGITLGGRF
jgi:hypothetical protein